VGAVVITATVLGIIFFHGATVRRIDKVKADNATLEQAIAKLKHDIGDYDVVKAQREALLKQRDAIKKLQANRSGPVWMMRELSDILTDGKGPTIDKAAYVEKLKTEPNAAFNASWEPKRVWLLDYAERAQKVTIKGAAKSDEDVAEFLKRLKQSVFFSNVYWQQTQPQFDTKLNVAYVTFDITCQVNY
jgi:type IV pilus assembly protein PilN